MSYQHHAAADSVHPAVRCQSLPLGDSVQTRVCMRSAIDCSAFTDAVLVTGPAGAGKSTFCAALITHAQSLGRSVHLFNLDPAADKFEYPPSLDIKDLISLDEVMEDLELGPNGGLIYCFESVSGVVYRCSRF